MTGFRLEFEVDSVPGSTVIDFEYRCYNYGKGEIGTPCENIQCENCKGTGAVLTNDGKALIEFLKRHLR